MRIYLRCGWFCAAVLSFSAAASTPPSAFDSPTPAVSTTPRAPSQLLTLAAAIDLALAQHPAIRDRELNLEASAAGLRQAGLRPNPEFEIQSENLAKGNQTVSLWLSQPIEAGGKRNRRVAVAEAERTLAELDLVKKRAEVVAQVRLAFMRALIWRQRVVLQKENLAVMTSWAASVQQRVDAGKASPLEGERAELAKLSAADALQRTEREWSIAMNELAASLGSDEPRGISATGIDASFVPSWERVQTLLRSSPQGRWLDAAIGQKEADVQWQRSVAVPDVRVSAGLQNDRASGSNGVLIGLAIPLPVLNRNQGAIAQANLRLQQARTQEVVGRRELELQALGAWERLRALQKAIRLYDEKLIPGAEHAFAKAREGYALGKFGFLDVLDAQRALVEARNQQTQALLDFVAYEAQLEVLLGTPLSELATAAQGSNP